MNIRISVGTIAALLFAAGQGFASDQGTSASVDTRILTEVMNLYGLDEASAVDRLAHEAEAADLHLRMNENTIAGYAGSWFDSSTQKLHVAVSDTRDLSRIERRGLYL